MKRGDHFMKLTKKAQMLFLIGGSILGGFQTGCDRSKDQLGQVTTELNQTKQELGKITEQREEAKALLNQAKLEIATLKNESETTKDSLGKLTAQLSTLQAQMNKQVEPQTTPVPSVPEKSASTQPESKEVKPQQVSRVRPHSSKKSENVVEQPESEVATVEPNMEDLKKKASELAQKDPQLAQQQLIDAKRTFDQSSQELLALKTRLNRFTIEARKNPNDPRNEAAILSLQESAAKVSQAATQAGMAVSAFQDGIEKAEQKKGMMAVDQDSAE